MKNLILTIFVLITISVTSFSQTNIELKVIVGTGLQFKHNFLYGNGGLSLSKSNSPISVELLGGIGKQVKANSMQDANNNSLTPLINRHYTANLMGYYKFLSLESFSLSGGAGGGWEHFVYNFGKDPELTFDETPHDYYSLKMAFRLKYQWLNIEPGYNFILSEHNDGYNGYFSLGLSYIFKPAQ